VEINMFSVGSPKEVLDPYEWLPGHGENSVSICSERMSLTLDVTYESDDDAGIKLKREIIFSGVCAFYKSSFPGASALIDVTYEGEWTIGSLVEFEFSEVADAWDEHFSGRLNIKHYLIQFLSENIQVHILGEGFELKDEYQA
jgi:hypothetical protein